MLFVGFYLGKMLKILEKRPFCRADMAGLGKYHMGGYGRIGVYRVKLCFIQISFLRREKEDNLCVCPSSWIRNRDFSSLGPDQPLG